MPNSTNGNSGQELPEPVDPAQLSDAELLTALESETQLALQRVYQLEQPTPLDSIELDNGCELKLKREDLSQVHSYKWRGSFNKILSMHQRRFTGAMVAASAGNHAQGVAIAANRLQLQATIYMPRSTPLLKQESVKKFGGQYVEIRLHGDSFDEASTEAKKFAADTDGALIPPYDDLQVIAGQSTIGVEMADAFEQPPTHVFLEFGGGGMGAGVSSVIKQRFPDTKLICVEAINQNCMGVSIAKDEPTTIQELDRFCDGTAVIRPGELPFRICKQLLDECVTVSNDQVCQAIQFTDRPATVLSGSNVDFMMLPTIARRGQVNPPVRRHYAFEIGEAKGTLNELLDSFLPDMNIIDFQYGKVAQDRAYPVIGVEVPHSAVGVMEEFLKGSKIPPHLDVTGTAAADFRVIPFNIDLLNHPFFAVIEFPNRPGALGDFMEFTSDIANVCYMNYTDSGQTEGQALMGFEFDNIGRQSVFLEWLQETTNFKVVPMAIVRGFNSSGDASDRLNSMN